MQQLAGELDAHFRIIDWHRDPAMCRWLPMVYNDIAYDLLSFPNIP